ncbi:hypothetical protein [Cellulomonas sp. ATA003]|uniref:hypothetical protein n=1 Tax=Cellulomonas sp. ATA003 TaxID=3073064 RepID=UPI002873F33B|nr:hypothetical protein [Cellulomonas sp. ATA003]WNB86362.1 hypothetical protein REH70_03690 [Cellulomonas sp. ATA003]
MVSHPAEWGPYRTDLLAGALADRHLPPFSLVADACAIVRHAVASGRLRLPGPAHVAVLDVREEHTSVAVVAVPVAAPVAARGAASGDGPVLVGAPRLLADLGAADLDDAVLGHVRRVAGAGEADDAPRLDRDSAAALRQACRRAADALLDGAAAVVRYPAPEGPRDVRVVPADLDARLRPRGTRTAGGAAAAVAALVPAGVDAVLLTGRPAALPLLTELVAQRFDAPITALPGDAEAAALGAAATPPGTTAQPSASRRARHRAGAADSDEPRHSRRRAPGSRRGRRRPATAVAGLGVVALGVLAVAVSDDASAADDASRRPAHEVTDERPRTGAVGG